MILGREKILYSIGYTVQRKTRILYLIASIQELANEIDDSTSEDISEATAEEIVLTATNVVLGRNKEPLTGSVDTSQVHFQLNDGSYQPLFGVSDEEDSV